MRIELHKWYRYSCHPVGDVAPVIKPIEHVCTDIFGNEIYNCLMQDGTILNVTSNALSQTVAVPNLRLLRVGDIISVPLTIRNHVLYINKLPSFERRQGYTECYSREGLRSWTLGVYIGLEFTAYNELIEEPWYWELREQETI